ncbi:hypothetical protein [Paenibacillus sp. J23TS9]|uniref:hypothetical protein n=1 Tax=Paenibacillus sp. J23TS9 TaxID=2807193 RepID=UPI001BD14D9D|nr:hypothetical protein [Paenibacillus sp. J23TS9]
MKGAWETFQRLKDSKVWNMQPAVAAGQVYTFNYEWTLDGSIALEWQLDGIEGLLSS